MSKNGWVYISIAYLSLFFMGTLDNARGPIYPVLLEEFGLNTWQGSWFFALTSMGSFFVPLTSYKWLPYLGPTNSMRVGWVLTFMSGILTWISSNYLQLEVLFLSCFVLGIGLGFIGMSMNLLISHGTNRHNRRQFFGGLHACYGIASLLSPLVYQFSDEKGIHWRDFYFTVACLFTLLLISFRKTPEPKRERPIEPAKSFLSSPLLSILIGAYVASEIVVSSRLVLYLQRVENFSEAMSSNYLAIFFFCLMAGRICMAIIPSQLFKSYQLMLISLVGTTVMVSLGISGFPLCLALTGLTMSVFFPCAMDMINNFFPERFEEMTSSALSGLGFFVMLMHLVFGAVAEYLGVSLAMASSIGFSLISFLCLNLFLRQRL